MLDLGSGLGAHIHSGTPAASVDVNWGCVRVRLKWGVPSVSTHGGGAGPGCRTICEYPYGKCSVLRRSYT